MALPDLDSNGYLPSGTHNASQAEIIERFTRGRYRMWFADTIENICSWAISRGATRLIIGGSFLSSTEAPNDVDLVLVFPTEAQIPSPSEHFETFRGSKLDIFFAAETTPDVINAFIRMFSRSKDHQEIGVASVRLPKGKGEEFAYEEPPEELSALVRDLYINRRIADPRGPLKVLIPVHGIKSHGEWYAELTEVCTGDGWIVAPFTYQYRLFTVLFDERAQNRIVDAFREHVAVIAGRYQGGVSVIAHSFGTYVAVKYLVGFVEPPVRFDTLILAGSILNRNLDFAPLRSKVHAIVNEVAPHDAAVGLVPAAAMLNPLMGTSGRHGFANPDPSFVTQNDGDTLFTHGNVIRRDIVYTRWLPRLNANVGRAPRYVGR